jgi:succinyl-diaminopimelate desuccinylase
MHAGISSSISAQIRSAISGCHDEIAEFIEALVAIPTENPPGREYKACAAAIGEKLRALGLSTEMREIPALRAAQNAEPGYCVTSSYGQGERTLYFHGHYDVVPAQSPQQFKPVLRGKHLFGRGSADMKGGLAAMIYAVKALKDLGVKLDGRIGLLFVPDEETGGARGSQALAQAGLLGANGIGMLTPEPTGGVIWNANRGAISMRITIRGKSVHVGLACRGVNAFERMLDVAAAFRKLKEEIATRKTAFRVTPDDARGSILLLGGRCEGGVNFNYVPAEYSLTLDRRVNPEEDLSTEKKRILDLLENFRREGMDLDYEILQEGRTAGVSENDPVAQALAESVREITGQSPAFEMCPGLLEIRFYAERGVPAFAYGPGLLSVSHGPDERISLENVESCAAIYALTAFKLLSESSTR